MTESEFEAVYSCYFSAVYKYLLKRCGDPSLSEELTSDTFFKALCALDGFRGECDVKSWLIQIAKNCLASHMRKNAGLHLLPMPIQDIAAQGSSPDAGDALDALRGLRAPYGEIVRLRVFGQLSFREIAKLFGKTENWACVSYHRARKMMREKLEENKDE